MDPAASIHQAAPITGPQALAYPVEGREDRCKGIPPFPETRDYVARVLALYGHVVHAFDESLTVASPLLR